MTFSDEKILFSIIIPTYNSSRFIRKCIKSITNFRYQFKYEILIVDDSSTDDTIKLVTDISNSFEQVRIFKTKVNSGPGVSRNIGIKNSKGKFLIFLDSDDIILPGSLLNLSKITDNNKNIKIILNNSLRNKPPYSNNFLFKLFKNNHVSTKKFLSKCLIKNIHIDEVWKIVVNRKFLLENKILFPKIYIGEDQCLILKLFKFSEQIFLNKKHHIKHNYNSTGISQKTGNTACVSYALVAKYLFTIKSRKDYINRYLKFKIKAVKTLSFLNFILLDKNEKTQILKTFFKKKINVKLFKKELKIFTNSIFSGLSKYNLKSKDLDFFIYCADIYGQGFHKLIKDKCKVKGFIDDNKEIKKNIIFKNRLKSLNSMNFSKRKKSVFFVCIKDLNKFKDINQKIKKTKLIEPMVERIDF